MIDPVKQDEDDDRTLAVKETTVGHNDEGGEEVTLDELLADIPIGRFHYRLLVICGMAFMADAMEVLHCISHREGERERGRR